MKDFNAKQISELVSFRKLMHSYAELSGNEIKTSALIAERLKKLCFFEIRENVGGYSILAVYDSCKPGKTIMYRADMDALPIAEDNNFEYKSKNEKVAHKCGHDGHLTVLIGFAEWLKMNPPARGKIILLFQASEENGKGAYNVLIDNKFADISPDYVFAFHNLPGFPLNQILIKEGNFTASVSSLIFRLKGKTAHASEPENGINPTYAIAEIINFINNLNVYETQNQDFFLATPIFTKIGEKAYGTSAAYAEIHYTFRAWERKLLENKLSFIIRKIHEIATKYQLSTNYETLDIFYNTFNHKQAVEVIKEAAKLTGLNITESTLPFRWGEDFGLFTQKYNGAMFCLGAGENSPALHHADYDFNDELIAKAIVVFKNINILINS